MFKYSPYTLEALIKKVDHCLSKKKMWYYNIYNPQYVPQTSCTKVGTAKIFNNMFKPTEPTVIIFKS